MLCYIELPIQGCIISFFLKKRANFCFRFKWAT